MAQVGKQFSAIEIDDAKSAKLTADTSGSLTYATSVDIPEIVEIAPEPQFKEALLEGDAGVDDMFAKVTHVNFSLTARAVPLDVLADWIGGTVAQSGTTPNTQSDWTLLSTDKTSFFRLQGRWLNAGGIDAADGAQAHVTLHKCKLNRCSFRLNGQYAEVQASGVAIRTKNNKKLISTTFYESATALT